MSGRNSEATKVGVVTSVATHDSNTIALAYLKCKKKGVQVPLQGTQVYINGQPAKVCVFVIFACVTGVDRQCAAMFSTPRGVLRNPLQHVYIRDVTHIMSFAKHLPGANAACAGGVNTSRHKGVAH